MPRRKGERPCDHISLRDIKPEDRRPGETKRQARARMWIASRPPYKRPGPPKVEFRKRRCAARSRTRGDGRCGQFPLRGHRYCKFHGGAKRRIDAKDPKAVLIVANHYARVVKGRFIDLLKAANDDPQSERARLHTEVDATRMVAMEAISVACGLMEKPDAPLAAKHTAMEIAHKALREVRDSVLAMVKADALAPEQLQAHQVDAIITQVANSIGRHVKDAAAVLAIMKDMEDIKVPERRNVAAVTISI